MGGGGGQTFRPTVFPGRNRVVNSIRFCFLWQRENSGRAKEREERWARSRGGSKTLVCSVSGDGGSQRSGGGVRRNIKGEGEEREGEEVKLALAESLRAAGQRIYMTSVGFGSIYKNVL